MPTADIGPDNPQVLSYIGPTIEVAIGFDLEYRSAPGTTPNIPLDLYPALVDTGARDSCIDAHLANALNLVMVDQQRIAGIGGPQHVNRYAAHLYIPALNWVISGIFPGVHLVSGGQPHVALLGRSFLMGHRLTYDGRTGLVQLSNDQHATA